MIARVLTLFSLLAVSSSLLAQTNEPKKNITQPTSNPGGTGKETPKLAPTAPLDPKLESLLLEWESKMSKIEKLASVMSREDKEGTRGNIIKWTGRAAYLKPNLAFLDLTEVMVQDPKRDTKRDPKRELFISNGNNMYEYKMQEKKIILHELPKNGNSISDDSLLSFIFGMKAATAKERYELALHIPKQNTDWYHYVRIKPRYDADKQEFEAAEMVLYAKPAEWQYLPARLWFKSPNGGEVTWTFEKYDLNANITKSVFVTETPKGWQIEKAKAPQAPNPNDLLPKNNIPGPAPSKVRSSSDKN